MTFIFLDTKDVNYARKVADACGVDTVLTDEFPWVELLLDPDVPTHVFYGVEFDNSADHRMIQLVLASQGAILLSDREVHSPLYAGKIPQFPGRAKTHLDYAVERAQMFRVPGLKYSGPSYQDPKNVIILDSKVNRLQFMQNVLEKAHEKWWSSVGYLGGPEDDSLADALNDLLYYSSIIYLTKGVGEKIKELGRTEGVLDASGISQDDPKLGIRLRTLTYRPETFDAEIDTTPLDRNREIDSAN